MKLIYKLIDRVRLLDRNSASPSGRPRESLIVCLCAGNQTRRNAFHLLVCLAGWLPSPRQSATVLSLNFCRLIEIWSGFLEFELFFVGAAPFNFTLPCRRDGNYYFLVSGAARPRAPFSRRADQFEAADRRTLMQICADKHESGGGGGGQRQSIPRWRPIGAGAAKGNERSLDKRKVAREQPADRSTLSWIFQGPASSP